MDDPVPVPLKAGPYLAFHFILDAAPAVGAETCLGMKEPAFNFLGLFPDRHSGYCTLIGIRLVAVIPNINGMN